MNIISNLPGLKKLTGGDAMTTESEVGEPEAKKARIDFHRRSVRNGPVNLKSLTSGQVKRASKRALDRKTKNARRRQIRQYLADQREAATLRGHLQAAGVISAAHARVIIRCVDGLPLAVQAEHDLAVQQTLVEHAHSLNPRQLAVCARRVTDCLDPDGTLTTERDRARRRELHIQPRPDGSAHIQGELTPLCAEALLTVLDTLARPAPATDGQRDPRTPRAAPARRPL